VNDLAQAQGPLLKSMKMKTVVVSTTLNAAQHTDVSILSSGIAKAVAELKAESGKDIWLFGGGVLFRSLLEAGLVDSVEVAVSPVLLGGGVLLLPEGRRWPLRLGRLRDHAEQRDRDAQILHRLPQGFWISSSSPAIA
jgi:dihydrofolate reductase